MTGLVAMITGAALVALGSGLPYLSRTDRYVKPALWAQILGTTVMGAWGAAVFAGVGTLGVPFRDSFDPAMGVDPLSGFFLLTLAIVTVPALGFALGTLPGSRGARSLSALTGAFVLAMTGVLVARDVTTFLAFWELMTILPATAILVSHHGRSARHDVYVYLATTHLGGVGVWVALLALARFHALGDPSALAGRAEALQIAIGLAALIGFGTKAGLMPLHAWLPRAHPIAPSHFSALMSGMMIKVAIYGLIRFTLGWPARSAALLGVALLALGLLSCLGGVLYALIQHELKRLLAFHSVENVGIIALGLGVAFILNANGDHLWAALALAAALLHTMNHAVFKGLLFLGAGSFHNAVGKLDLDHLGGLLRRMPWTGGAFLIGSMAIAGLPPFNGFASEWLTLEALLHGATDTPLRTALPTLIALAGLAGTAALAVLCFTKVVGLVLLGPPRREACATAQESSRPVLAGLVALATLCVVLGCIPGILVARLVSLAPGSPVRLPMTSGIDITGTGSFPAAALLAFLVAGGALLVLLRSRRAAAPAPVWTCGQPVEAPLRWTSAAFTKPLRLLMEPVLKPERSVAIERNGVLVESVAYESHTPHLFDTLLYRPVVRAALAWATFLRRVQSGSLRAYIATLLGLVIALLALARLGLMR